MKSKKFTIAPEVIMKVRDFSTIMAVMIALVILNFYKYDLVPREDGAYDYMPFMEPQYY